MTGGEQVACLAIAICFCVSVTLLAIDSVLASASRPRLHAKGEAGDDD